jgi:5-methylcytosine-specific restriction endonuclease McrA
MGRRPGSRTGIIQTIGLTCLQCGATYSVLGKRRRDGPRPSFYCSPRCYHATQSGKRPPGFMAHPGGAPKGRIPWNKGKRCPQLSGQRNGMHGHIHTDAARAKMAKAAEKSVPYARPPVFHEERLYRALYRKGWRKARRAALLRDGNACALCKATTRRLDVHHIVPFCFSLSHALENLITLCLSCHSRIPKQAAALIHQVRVLSQQARLVHHSCEEARLLERLQAAIPQLP